MGRLKKKANVKEVNQYMNSSEWRNLARKMIKKAGYRCQCCGVSCFRPPWYLRFIVWLFSFGKWVWKVIVLEVHHKKDISNNFHLKDDPDNLMVMCFDCHRGSDTGFHTGFMRGTRNPTNPDDLNRYFKWRYEQGLQVLPHLINRS